MSDRFTLTGFVCTAAGSRVRALGWLCALSLMLAFVRPCGLDGPFYPIAAGPLLAVLCVLLAERVGRASRRVTFEIDGETILWPGGAVRSKDVGAWDGVSSGGQLVAVLTTLSDETWWFIVDDGPAADGLLGWLGPANRHGELRIVESTMTLGSVGVGVAAPILLGSALYVAAAGYGIHEAVFFGNILLLLTSFGCCFMILGAALRRPALSFDCTTIVTRGVGLLERARATVGRRGRLLIEVDGVARRVWIAPVMGREARQRLGLDEATVCHRILEARIQAIQPVERGAFR